MNDHQMQPALPLPLLEAWQRQFVNRSQPYAVQQPDGSYRWVYAPCTLDVMAQHLSGALTLALSSTDSRGWCRWLCLDVDTPASPTTLEQLISLRTALAAEGLPGVVEASRRGGHLWLLFDAPLPAYEARWALVTAVAHIQQRKTNSQSSRRLPPYELYPDTTQPGTLGHAVRLPLGIHRKTGQRYPFFDAEGNPCAFTSTEAAVSYLLAHPRSVAQQISVSYARWFATADSSARLVSRHERHDGLTDLRGRTGEPATESAVQHRVGTHSSVIRWVDANVSALDLLADLAPESEMRAVGRGYLGWCPFHNDRAPASDGSPGSPSFYAVLDRRHGWSWRCLSSNCAYSWGMLRHSFELFQQLLDLSVKSAIVEACHRWPEADQHHNSVQERRP